MKRIPLAIVLGLSALAAGCSSAETSTATSAGAVAWEDDAPAASPPATSGSVRILRAVGELASLIALACVS